MPGLRRRSDLTAEVDDLRATLNELQRRIDELEAGVRDDAVRLDATTRASVREAVAASREHAEAAVEAGVAHALAAAREHAEAAAAVAAQHSSIAGREHTEAAVQVAAQTTLAAAREHTEAAVASALGEVRSTLAQMSRRIAALELSASRASKPVRSATERSSAAVDAALYADLEDRFRGSQQAVRDAQAAYADVVARAGAVDGVFCDLGCGRGEWLDLVTEAGHRATGVDLNPVFVADCRARGLEVSDADAFEHLASLDDGSVALLSAFHLIEHLQFADLVALFAEAARVVAPGGALLVETPNGANLSVGASTFWLDHTHVRPLRPDLLEMLAGRVGFHPIEVRLLHPIRPAELPPATPLGEMERLLFGPQDVGLVAWRPEGSSA